MGLIHSKLDRRKFLKVGSLTLMSPFIIKALGLIPTRIAAAASSVSDAYNRAINKMVEDFRKRASTMVGWASGRGSATVTALGLVSSASAVAHNPFWRNEGYATATRWGGLIAYPMHSAGGNSLTTVPFETDDTGIDRQLWPGQDWEFFQPIRVGDTLRAWCKSPQVTEQKFPDRGGIRGFLNLESDVDVVNQRGEIVTNTQNYTVRIFYPGGAPGPRYLINRYGFTEAEIFYLDRLARSESLRGKEIRYWEDVKVGDPMEPVVIGPTNMNDIGSQSGSAAGPGELAAAAAAAARPPEMPISKLLEKEGMIGKEEYIQGTAGNTKGFYYKGGGGGMRHWDDIIAQAEGEPGAFLWGNMSIRCMLRCLTNWIGDDAFVRQYSWRHVERTLVGDASFASGKVTNKRMENGEYLVDVFIKQRSIRGYIVDAAVATVALRSRTETYPGLKKVINY